MALLEWKDQTVQVIRDSYESQLNGLVDFLLTIEIDPDGSHVLLLYDVMDYSTHKYGLDICMIEEVRNDLRVSGYSFQFSEWQETLGYLVADNKLTQDNIEVLLCEYLKEITEEHH